MRTAVDIRVPNKMFKNYLTTLVDQFFKILPLKEDGEPSLNEYLRSLQLELIGCHDLIVALKNDAMFLRLICILQYLIENDCDIPVVKREVFKAIATCKKLQEKYFGKEV